MIRFNWDFWWSEVANKLHPKIEFIKVQLEKFPRWLLLYFRQVIRHVWYRKIPKNTSIIISTEAYTYCLYHKSYFWSFTDMSLYHACVTLKSKLNRFMFHCCVTFLIKECDTQHMWNCGVTQVIQNKKKSIYIT